MVDALPFPNAAQHFATDIVRRLREAGHVAYWAGGCVRDLLLGKPPKDYDVATDARPEQVRTLFGQHRTRAVGAAFGVILVHGPRAAGDIEVATFRSEGPYLDGRRPEHVVFCSAEQDAQRRDFTINGMFFDPVTQQVLDFVDGQTDLKRRVIRAIGNPLERFREDKLRLLRAIRFAANLAFELDPQTAAAIREMAPEIRIVSAERIAQEWKRMLIHDNRGIALTLAADTAILGEVFPEAVSMLQSDTESRQRWDIALRAINRLHQPRFELVVGTWLADLPGYDAAAARAMCNRLRLSNDETACIVWLQTQSHAIDGAPAFPLSKLKRLLAHADIHDSLAQTRARLEATSSDLTDLQFCEDYLRSNPPEVINPPQLITGDDLIRHGLRPGKQFKPLLEALRDAQLENRTTSFDEALALAKQLSSRNQSDPV